MTQRLPSGWAMGDAQIQERNDTKTVNVIIRSTPVGIGVNQRESQWGGALGARHSVVGHHSASAAQRNPTVAERSMLGAISRYLPCSSSL